MRAMTMRHQRGAGVLAVRLGSSIRLQESLHPCCPPLLSTASPELHVTPDTPSERGPFSANVPTDRLKRSSGPAGSPHIPVRPQAAQRERAC